MKAKQVLYGILENPIGLGVIHEPIDLFSVEEEEISCRRRDELSQKRIVPIRVDILRRYAVLQ